MARTTVRLSFSGQTANDPVIYQMGKQFNVVTNLRRADVGDDSSGWIELDIEGDVAAIAQALEFCRSRGVQVEQLKS
jgi:L-aspartate semialdehyde sulfurtransferase ferredoxin